MNVPTKSALLALTVLWLAGCQASQEAKQESVLEVELDTTLSSPASQPDQAALADALEAPPAVARPDRQFVRTANLKVKVDNVVNATDRIEAITAQQSGFVTFTKLDSQTDGTETIAVSPDSLLETTHYTVSNMMTLRVPNHQLDTTLRAVAALAEHIDYRLIKADDVALQRLANARVGRRNAAHDGRLRRAIDGRGRKLGETTQAEESRLIRQQQADEAQIDDLSLADQVQFSTVSLTLYQRQAMRRVMLPNTTNVREYEPGLLTKAADAFASGAHLLIAFLLLLLESWGILAFFFSGYALYRYVRGRTKLGV